MRILIIYALSIVSVGNAIAQNLDTIYPTLGLSNIYLPDEQAYWEEAISNLTNLDLGNIEYLELDHSKKEAIDKLEMLEGPFTQSVACSWYCGGGPYKITSSEVLSRHNKISYTEENIHDFSLFTAWAPRRKTEIGAEVNFHFEGLSPPVTRLIIYNGYLKNIKLWKENSRAKSIKISIDGVPRYICVLEDVTSSQTFEIEEIQSKIEAKDKVITLSILEIYEGSKYRDLAISEINFDGTGVH